MTDPQLRPTLDISRKRNKVVAIQKRRMWNFLRTIVATGVPTEPLDQTNAVAAAGVAVAGKNLRKTIGELLGGRSLHIRHVDAGSSNAEEFELTAAGNAFYDLERFGIGFVASPRHADILTVSGPVTRNMEHALKTAYEMMPRPRIVVAVGDGACTGGIWRGSYALAAGTGAVEDVIPVDVKIPGDPPSPQQFIEGLLAAIAAARR